MADTGSRSAVPRSTVHDITPIDGDDAPVKRPRDDSATYGTAAASLIDRIIGDRIEADLRATIKDSLADVVDAVIRENEATRDREAGAREPSQPLSLRGLVAAIVFAGLATVAAPVVARVLPSRDSEIHERLDHIQQAIDDDRADTVGLTRWLWEIELADRAGTDHPGPPPSVRLQLAREDVEQSK